LSFYVFHLAGPHTCFHWPNLPFKIWADPNLFKAIWVDSYNNWIDPCRIFPQWVLGQKTIKQGSTRKLANVTCFQRNHQNYVFFHDEKYFFSFAAKVQFLLLVLLISPFPVYGKNAHKQLEKHTEDDNSAPSILGYSIIYCTFVFRVSTDLFGGLRVWSSYPVVSELNRVFKRIRKL